jgi:hypothetical protein
VHTSTQDANDPIWNKNNTPQKEKPDVNKKTNNTFEKELAKERCYEKFFSEANKLLKHTP